MADLLSPEKRSQNMAAIKSRNTKPEVYFRKLLYEKGYRYRISEKSVWGHPDVFLRKYNTAIFINGCFWHRHSNCKYAYNPKTNISFWTKKFDQNMFRDKKTYATLLEQKIKCLVVWECSIRKMINSEEIRNRVIQRCMVFLSSTDLYYEIDLNTEV